MLKRFDARIVVGLILLLGGVVLLLQTMGVLDNAQGLFWGGLLIVAGLAFLVLLFGGNWWAAFPGMVLLALGVSALLPERLEDFSGMAFLVGIGLSFWIVYFMDRSRWWALIPAGILTTLGIMTVLPDRVGNWETGGFFFLGMSLTFALVGLLAGMRWAYWPAAVLGVMGVLITASLMSIANYLWAAALIVIGAYMIFRYFTNRAAQ